MQAGIHASSGVRSADPASQHQRSARNITSLHLPAPRHLQRHQLQHVPASGVQQGPAVACRAAATTTPEIAVAVPAPRQQPAATGTSSHPVTNNPTAADEIAQANAQSLVTLEWPAICRQVACFCGTSMAAELLLTAKLPIGSSQAESELLLQQTQEALDLELQVSGVFDLRPALGAAVAGGVLNPKQLEGVAASLEAAFQLKAVVSQQQQQQGQQHDQQQQGGQHQQQYQQRRQRQNISRQQQQQCDYPCLADVAAAIPDRELALLGAIRSCIRDGAILSDASEELAAIRAARQTNKEAARSLVTAIARQLHAKGAAEGREPLLLRGRYCVAVRTNQRSAVSKGSVKLGASGTGATLYIEPAEVLDLNNREALLSEQESEAEIAVLSGLSQLLSQRAPAVHAILDAVTMLDIIAARAKHAVWLDGVRPLFVGGSSSNGSAVATRDGPDLSDLAGSSQQQQQQGPDHADDHKPSSPMFIPGARHPLLMQAALPQLPTPPSIDDAAFDSDFVPPPLWATATSSSESDSESDTPNNRDNNGVLGSRPMPKPLDLRVPGDVRVVAITGPNTGGKTVALKSAGLCALMAKAGLFLPVDRADLAAAAAAAAASPGSSSGLDPSGPDPDRPNVVNPSLQWFDQVLADIGDSQNLQQNLSTFSGHIRRLNLLLAAAGSGSLVLLDEVGSGTDPQEGAALARAVLDVLADKARLTLATSHHAELKTAADEDSRYINVSMEFNVSTLQPTYKLCWGSSGSSNALDIAQALGFDSRVLAEARILARSAAAEQQQQQRKGTMDQVAGNIEAQLDALTESVAALHKLREEGEKKAEAYRDKTRQLMMLRNKLKGRSVLVQREQAEIVLQVQQAAKDVRQGRATLADIQSVIDFYQAKVTPGSDINNIYNTPDQLKPGDDVIVPRLRIPDRQEVASGPKDMIDLMKFTVVKVVGDIVWVSHPLLSTVFSGLGPGMKSKGPKGIKVFRSECIRAEQITVPQEGLVGLAGYDSSQAAAEQQIIEDADSMLAGKVGQQQQQQQAEEPLDQQQSEDGVSGQQQQQQREHAVPWRQQQQQHQGAGIPGQQQQQQQEEVHQQAEEQEAQLIAGSNVQHQHHQQQQQQPTQKRARGRQQQQQQGYVWVEQISRNTLDLENVVPEAAVDQLTGVIKAHQAQTSSSSSSTSTSTSTSTALLNPDQADSAGWGLQEAGGSGFLEGGVLYVKHSTGSEAVKQVVLKCLSHQQGLGAVRRYKAGQEGAAAGRTVVWLAV